MASSWADPASVRRPPTATNTTYDMWLDAERRVLRSPRLRRYVKIIMANGYADSADHLRWVIRGRVGEIEAWAKQIQEDSDE